MKTKLLFVLSAVLTCMVMTPLQGFAQSEENLIEEIVVTAQKREQRAFDVPLSLETMLQDDLDQGNFEQFRYLIAASPKLKAMSNFASFSSVLTSRGIVGSTNLDQVVSTYIDDVPFLVVGAGWSPNNNLFDLQRVEMIGGPQGTLYGQGSLAGTLRIITNQPDTQQASAAIKLGAANVTDGEEDYSYSGYLNVPIVKDKLAARLVYSKQMEGGFIDGTGFFTGPIDDYNDNDYEDVRIKVLATPTENLTINATYWDSEVENDIADAEFGGIFAVFLGAAPPRQNHVWFQVGSNSSEAEAWSLKVDYDFGPVTITNAYSDLDFYIFQDTYALISVGFAEQPVRTKTNELRVTSNLDGPLQFVAGHYYLDGQNQFDVQISLPFPPPGVFLGFNRLGFDSEVSALFGEVSYDLFDGRVTLLGGIRDFEDERSFYQVVSTTPLPNLTLAAPTINSETFTKTTTRFNVSVQPVADWDWNVFLNVSDGFRSGNFNAQISIDGANLAGFPSDTSVVEPDEVTSYDLGTKFNLPNGMFSAELTMFWAELEGAQTSVDFTRGARLFAATFVNAGDLEIFGVDYNLTFRPTNSLAFNLQGAYLDTEWGNLAPLIDQFSGLSDGAPAAGVPENQIIGSVRYDRPVSWFGGLDFTAYADYRYESRTTDTTAVPGNDTPSHNKINVRLTLAREGSWSASLYVDNLTDEDDIISSAFNGFNTPPRPRQIGVTFRKDFTF